jgi:hypothetical protein
VKALQFILPSATVMQHREKGVYCSNNNLEGTKTSFAALDDCDAYCLLMPSCNACSVDIIGINRIRYNALDTCGMIKNWAGTSVGDVSIKHRTIVHTPQGVPIAADTVASDFCTMVSASNPVDCFWALEMLKSRRLLSAQEEASIEYSADKTIQHQRRFPLQSSTIPAKHGASSMPLQRPNVTLHLSVNNTERSGHGIVRSGLGTVLTVLPDVSWPWVKGALLHASKHAVVVVASHELRHHRWLTRVSGLKCSTGELVQANTYTDLSLPLSALVHPFTSYPTLDWP